MNSNAKINDTQCARSFESRDTIFLTPGTTSVFRPGDTAYVSWYAGVIPEGKGSPKMNTTFNLVLSAFRDETYVYKVLENTTVPFSGRTYSDPVYWSYIPSAPCPATEISYFWPIPTNFTPASDTDFDYVLLVETIIETGWALAQSDPFRIVAPLPSSSSTSTSTSASNSPTNSASSVDNSIPTASPDTNLNSNSNSNPDASRSNSIQSASPGTKAGIAVGTIFGGITLILGAWFFYRKRRKANLNSQWDKTGTYGGTTVTDYTIVGGTDTILSGNEKVEIDGRQMPRESGGTALHELEAAQRREQRDTVDTIVISEITLTTDTPAAPKPIDRASDDIDDVLVPNDEIDITIERPRPLDAKLAAAEPYQFPLTTGCLSRPITFNRNIRGDLQTVRHQGRRIARLVFRRRVTAEVLPPCRRARAAAILVVVCLVCVDGSAQRIRLATTRKDSLFEILVATPLLCWSSGVKDNVIRRLQAYPSTSVSII
ncbi:hypothetical protein GQX73_g10006 [Xylaria multiplex]|uniref:Uncharacterized protein n=1 Tax=Xylaria multiplex TaxID=323545 RepID=A0A7C8MIS3_9PEZI|nr:hypothetical protein GQX73_g10006 [Xylaria multiplex]